MASLFLNVRELFHQRVDDVSDVARPSLQEVRLALLLSGKIRLGRPSGPAATVSARQHPEATAIEAGRFLHNGLLGD
jgi:hypothetical protein